MNKRGGLTNIQNYVVGIILGCIVFIGGMLWAGSAVKYSGISSPELDQFNSSMSKLENIGAVNDKLQSSLSSGNNNGPLGWLDFLIGSAWLGLTAIASTLGFVPQAILGFGNMLGIPPIITGLLVGIPLVIIVFGIWMAILRVMN